MKPRDALAAVADVFLLHPAVWLLALLAWALCLFSEALRPGGAS